MNCFSCYDTGTTSLGKICWCGAGSLKHPSLNTLLPEHSVQVTENFDELLASLKEALTVAYTKPNSQQKSESEPEKEEEYDSKWDLT